MQIATETNKEIDQVRNNCGFFLLDGWSILTAKGKETFSFLQTQTTNDALQLEVGEGQASAVTDRQARLIANFSIHRNSTNEAWLLSEESQTLYNHLESYHFREDITFEAIDQVLLALQGPKSILVLEKLFTVLPEKPNAILQLELEGNQVTLIKKSLTGEEGFVLCFSPNIKEDFLQKFLYVSTEIQPLEISAQAQETLRIEAGIPVFGKDMDSKNILPETGLEHSSVSYNKGCYIGQEVIARIKTYGAPNFALMGLTFEGPVSPPMNGSIFFKEKKIGIIKSSIRSPSIGKIIALAYLHKDHRSPDIEMDVMIDKRPYKTKTCLLPFYQAPTRKEHSKKLLNEALKIYKEQENLDEPITILREAIDIYPKHAEAYEALGVFLSKQDKLDEAIALMKRLVEINPQEIMAHSNLSVYYMKQGRIEDAENEKAEATALQFEQAVEKNMAKKLKKKAEEQNKKEMEEKIEMFKKVLKIDPVDQVANFGLGSIYLETGRYKEGIGPLTTLVENFKDYSAAYLLLGKTLEKLSENKKAIDVYKKGIAAASKKGDLMPLKDMQNRMNQLLHSSP
ncbi:MAG: tetratricopeptide repeat protein [Nitrospinota bacterium]|nr:tetratricopeptide repeat protein [Nitrospinota bacterium]